MKCSVPILLVLLVLLVGFVCPASAFADVDPGDENALNSVTQAVCHRQVVMLGESATHGDGHTEAFKVALVEKLINECGFDSIYFEASHYEFIHLNRQLQSRKAVSASDLSAAIGGLWKFDKEFQPLVPFLLSKAIAGQVTLGGIDDQLGQLGQDYANVAMIANLTMVLPQPEIQQCNLALHRRIYSEDWEGNGYSKSDRAEITSCLSDIRRRYAEDQSTANRLTDEEWLEMIDAVQRWINRDPLPGPEQMVERDRSMFHNLQWLRRRQPERHKVILWAATVHIARRADPTWAEHTGTNLGSLVHVEYGAQAFSLGFSSLGGRYRQGREIKTQPDAPAGSLEAKALQDRTADVVFLGPKQLAAMGSLPGAVFRHSYQPLPWSDYLDGVVVFKEEYPPTSTRDR